MGEPVVNSHNEWDPLEEVIVGVVDGATELGYEIAVEGVVERNRLGDYARFSRMNGGKPRATPEKEAAKRDLAELVHLLEAEGVTVRRPEPLDWAKQHATPDWSVPGGKAQSCPRDTVVVIGDELIEAPMSWRARYFETLAYKPLFKEYFSKGARWTCAPKAQMTAELYDWDFLAHKGWVTTEFEPVWDAADIARFGRDLFVQRSHATNESGIEWLRRHLGDKYRVHRVEFDDDRAIHIDATFMPLAPGKLLVNPDRPIKQLPECFKKAGWEILTCPETTIARSDPDYRRFQWLHLNMLNLDEKRIIVEKTETNMIRALKEWGFTPIPCNFKAFYSFGGAFHCATLDVRRRGKLQSYF